MSRQQQVSMLTTRLREALHWHYMPHAHGTDWEQSAESKEHLNHLVKVEIDNYLNTLANLSKGEGNEEGNEGAADEDHPSADTAGEGSAPAADGKQAAGESSQSESPPIVKRKYEKNKSNPHWNRGGGNVGKVSGRAKAPKLVHQQGKATGGPSFEQQLGAQGNPIDVAALSATLVGSMRSQGLLPPETDTTSMQSTVSEMESKVGDMERELMQVVLSRNQYKAKCEELLSTLKLVANMHNIDLSASGHLNPIEDDGALPDRFKLGIKPEK